MFKRVLLLAAAILAFPLASNAQTLSQFYDGHLPTLQERSVLAIEAGISNYHGTADQNSQLLSFLSAKPQSLTQFLGATPSDATQSQGYNPVTGYQSTLTSYIAGNATTIPVVSTNDLSGSPINLANISPSTTVKVYMTLEPGNPTNQEEILCTGVTTQSWTNCIRGLPFQGGSEIASTTLQKTHNAGSSVIITNVSQFYNQFISVDGSQQINGVKTFTALPFSTVTLPTSSLQFATKQYVDSVGAGGFTAANVSTTLGLFATGSAPAQVGINASSTTGGAFDQTGAYYQKVNTSTGLGEDTNGIKIVTTTLINFIASTTPIAGLLPEFQSNFQINVSSTPVSSTNAASKNYVDTSLSGNIKGVSTTFKNIVNNTDTSTTVPGMIFSYVAGTVNGANCSLTIQVGATTSTYTTLMSFTSGGISGAVNSCSGSGLVPANYFYKTTLSASSGGNIVSTFIPFLTY